MYDSLRCFADSGIIPPNRLLGNNDRKSRMSNRCNQILTLPLPPSSPLVEEYSTALTVTILIVQAKGLSPLSKLLLLCSLVGRSGGGDSSWSLSLLYWSL